ncbi:hypothetical protein SCHIN_v1c08760 [Spiroplasma chinense]|uniref:Lipoprotein n=1 Tax=Spiroplasma chinense TaxID=216932 RepID=A0A5B9Y4U8_9MOLU|nr:hypothetical protein [Spiroplasma chinense]QEH62071.1 hypothetical protein SCHIN_v1c08760 [Spiroplasma chinense]
MKKMLAFLSSITFVTLSTSSIVSCDSGNVEVFAPANSDLSILFQGKTLEIENKTIEDIEKEIKKLKIISTSQYEIKGEVDFSSDKGIVKIVPKEDFFLPVVGEAILDWVHINAKNEGETPDENVTGKLQLSKLFSESNINMTSLGLDENIMFMTAENMNDLADFNMITLGNYLFKALITANNSGVNELEQRTGIGKIDLQSLLVNYFEMLFENKEKETLNLYNFILDTFEQKDTTSELNDLKYEFKFNYESLNLLASKKPNYSTDVNKLIENVTEGSISLVFKKVIINWV